MSHEHVPESAAEQNPNFDLQEMLGHLIRTSQQVHAALWKARLGRQLTSPQFAVLHTLAHTHEVKQANVRARASLDRSTAADIIQRLIDRGWVTRRRDDTDSRRNVLQITALGAQVYRDAYDEVLKINDMLLGELNKSDTDQLVHLLVQLVDRHREGENPGERKTPDL